MSISVAWTLVQLALLFWLPICALIFTPVVIIVGVCVGFTKIFGVSTAKHSRASVDDMLDPAPNAMLDYVKRDAELTESLFVDYQGQGSIDTRPINLSDVRFDREVDRALAFFKE